MSQTEIDRFLQDMKTNRELQAEVNARSGDIAEIAKIANARGYSVSAEEVRAGIALGRPGLTEDEEDLGHIAGELLRDLAKRQRKDK